jgi:hypothetical protein
VQLWAVNITGANSQDFTIGNFYADYFFEGPASFEGSLEGEGGLEDFPEGPDFPFDGIIPAGEEMTFDITFDPSADGFRSARVEIVSNDPDAAIFDFAIQGTGVIDDVVGNTTGFDFVNNGRLFGDVPAGPIFSGVEEVVREFVTKVLEQFSNGNDLPKAGTNDGILLFTLNLGNSAGDDLLTINDKTISGPDLRGFFAMAAEILQIQLPGRIAAPIDLDIAMSFDGEVPPAAVAIVLNQNLRPEGFVELSAAIEFDGNPVLGSTDGPVILNLDGPAPNEEVKEELVENLVKEVLELLMKALGLME